MTVNAAFQPQDENNPVQGGYIQPGPGVTAALVTLTDTGGVSLTGAAGTAAAPVLSVQGIAGGTALPVSGTVTAGGVAQGSATSGQTGTLVQGAVTTSAPTYTTAQTNPLSLTTAGALRTVDNATVAQASATSGQVGPLVQGAVTTAAPTYTTAQSNPLSLTTAGALRVDGSAVVYKLYRDSIVTAQASAASTGPGAGATIATVTPGTAGMWEVSGLVAVTGTTVGAADSNNMELRQTAAAVLNPIPMAMATAGIQGAIPFGPVTLSLSDVDTVNIIAIGAATGTATYSAQIVCRRVG